MKGLSTLRKTDAVGRIVIPIEIRKELNIGKDDSVEILNIHGEGFRLVIKTES